MSTAPILNAIFPKQPKIASDNMQLDKSTIMPIKMSDANTQTSAVGLFKIIKRTEEEDSFAFLSTVVNSDAEEVKESDKNEVKVTPANKFKGIG